jgi:hypothetical protein
VGGRLWTLISCAKEKLLCRRTLTKSYFEAAPRDGRGTDESPLLGSVTGAAGSPLLQPSADDPASATPGSPPAASALPFSTEAIARTLSLSLSNRKRKETQTTTGAATKPRRRSLVIICSLGLALALHGCKLQQAQLQDGPRQRISALKPNLQKHSHEQLLPNSHRLCCLLSTMTNELNQQATGTCT